MKLSALKKFLSSQGELSILDDKGEAIPAHFHVTEVGILIKQFFDCGGVVHQDNVVNVQLWVAEDYDHRLTGEKLLKIIEMSMPLFQGHDLDVEAEYQTNTIGRYKLDVIDNQLRLVPKATDCLAPVRCDLPQPETANTGCAPGSGCC